MPNEKLLAVILEAQNSKQNEISFKTFILDQYCHLEDDGSPFFDKMSEEMAKNHPTFLIRKILLNSKVAKNAKKRKNGT